MSFRLRTIEFTADGRRIVRDRDVGKPVLTIGRAAENDIHLPDLAVDPTHARLEAKGDGRVAAEALGTLGFGLDGVSTMRADIDPAKGAELRFGTCNLTVSRDGDGVPLLTIAQVESQDAGEAMDEKKSFSLASVMPGKRSISWYLALLIFAVFVAFPIASNALYDPAGKATVMGDASWSSGKLSLAHHALEEKCEACHVKPFEPVQDKACLACHQSVHDHAEPARLSVARADQPLGTRFLWSVAHSFGKPGPGACTDCHTEHEGAGRMEPAAQEFCSDCHATLKDRLTDTRLGNAGDFGTAHPQFSPAVPLTLGSRELTRVSLDEKPIEQSGLAFPHALHLDRTGGVARMAASIGAERGYGASGMQCKDCHRPTEDGVRFLPIDMERDCESCHSLAYDKVGGTFRKLHHGDVDQMIADLSVANGPSPVVAGRKRPGDYAAGKAYYARFNPAAGSAGLAAAALSRDGICGECHTPSYSGGRLGVMPVTQVSRFMPHGWFDHKPHRQEKCTSCHAAETSKSSSDLLLPRIAQCRTCHLGEDETSAKVPSGCAMCHTYHPSGEARIFRFSDAETARRRPAPPHPATQSIQSRLMAGWGSGPTPLPRKWITLYEQQAGQELNAAAGQTDVGRRGVRVRIAQITDIHIGFDRGNPDEHNMQRLRAVLQRLVESPNRPDLLLLSGDLTEFGDAESYARLAQAVSICPFPVWPMTGNHDERAPLLAAFPRTPSQGGFIHYVLELRGMRLIVLDTLEPGRHGGAFCEARAAWLKAQLAADTQTPTIIAMHHPPFESGITWLDSSGREPWIARFADSIAGQEQVRGIIAGHLHRTIHTLWQGVSLTVCMSVAPAVALDLTPIDPERPDDRPLITDELAGYALHRWDGERLISHFECVGALRVLARYDETLQEVVRIIQDERTDQ